MSFLKIFVFTFNQRQLNEFLCRIDVVPARVVDAAENERFFNFPPGKKR